jgi:hypothetical protein
MYGRRLQVQERLTRQIADVRYILLACVWVWQVFNLTVCGVLGVAKLTAATGRRCCRRVLVTNAICARSVRVMCVDLVTCACRCAAPISPER